MIRHLFSHPRSEGAVGLDDASFPFNLDSLRFQETFLSFFLSQKLTSPKKCVRITQVLGKDVRHQIQDPGDSVGPWASGQERRESLVCKAGHGTAENLMRDSGTLKRKEGRGAAPLPPRDTCLAPSEVRPPSRLCSRCSWCWHGPFCSRRAPTHSPRPS